MTTTADSLRTLRALTCPTVDVDPVERLLEVAKTFVTKQPTPATVRVALDKLQVDPDYQRPPDREKIARMVTQPPDEPIKVNCRPDGSLWITDGQHRAAAAAIRGEDTVDAVVTYKDSQEEPQETGIMAKVAADDDLATIGLLLGHGARRDGKRVVLTLGHAGRVSYLPHGAEFVAKTERGRLQVEGGDARDVLTRLGLADLSLESGGIAPVGVE